MSELSNQNEETKSKLHELETERSKITELHQKSSSETNEKVEGYEKRIALLEQENKNLLDQFQDVDSNKSAQIAELQIKLKEFEDKCETAVNNVVKLEEEKRLIEENYTQNSAKSDESYKEMLNMITNEKAEMETMFKEKEQDLISDFEKRIAELQQESQNMQIQFQDSDSNKDAQITELQAKLKEVEDKYEDLSQNTAKLEDEKRTMEETYAQNLTKSEENFKEMQESMSNEKSELETKLKEREQELMVIFYFCSLKL